MLPFFAFFSAPLPFFSFFLKVVAIFSENILWHPWLNPKELFQNSDKFKNQKE
jgi:hypothetical protein